MAVVLITATAVLGLVVGTSYASGPMGPDDSTPAPSNPAPSNPTPTETFTPPTWVQPPPPTDPPGEPFMTTTSSTIDDNPPMPAPVPAPGAPVDVFTGSLVGPDDGVLVHQQAGCDAHPDECAAMSANANNLANSIYGLAQSGTEGSLPPSARPLINQYAATLVLALGADPNNVAFPTLAQALLNPGAKLLARAAYGDTKALAALTNMSKALKNLDLTFGGQ